jgi:ribosome-associated translation inhibitor RaiA
MTLLDFEFEFLSEIREPERGLFEEAEGRLRELAEGHDDMTGASVAVEELTQEETRHLYQARVVTYIKPANIAAVEKAETPEAALDGALSAVERQVRERREQFRKPWQQP